ncbi:MAG: nucleotide exchange factor GrpE [Lysobacterales bacterium]
MQTMPPDPGVEFVDANEATLSAEERAAMAEIDEVLRAREESLRLLAEMDNLRKRAARDVEAARKFGTERLLGDLLPIMDSLERGLEVPHTDSAKLREGMQLTLAMLDKTLAAHGLRALNPQGQSFDPALHQAMSTVPAGAIDAGKVAQVFQKGYTLNDRLVRPALVVVAEG